LKEFTLCKVSSKVVWLNIHMYCLNHNNVDEGSSAAFVSNMFLKQLNLCEVLDGRAPAKDSVKYPLDCGDPDAPEPLPVGAVGFKPIPKPSGFIF